MLKLLDTVLSSENVVEEFYKNYDNPDFKNWILNILPEVEAAKNLNQDNPWHIYKCLEHILHSVEEMNKQTKDLDPKIRRLLAYTMFFHDLGKPATHLRRYSKLYKREVDSFFKHNLKGVEIAKRSLNAFGFDSNEQELITLLIEEHDMFMFLTLSKQDNYHRLLTEEYVKEVVGKFSAYGDGYQILNYLIMIGRSDNLSQNPEMTQKSLHLLDVMEKMLNKLNKNRK